MSVHPHIRGDIDGRNARQRLAELYCHLAGHLSIPELERGRTHVRRTEEAEKRAVDAEAAAKEPITEADARIAAIADLEEKARDQLAEAERVLAEARGERAGIERMMAMMTSMRGPAAGDDPLTSA